LANTTSGQALDREAESILESISESRVSKNRETIGDVARGKLFEIRHLGIGQPAPEIAGRDVNGKEFKLSDYRGRVVVIDFWGDWCGPCRAMYPHVRSLVKKLEGKPFVFLGINSDSVKNRQSMMKREDITWRFWCDGSAEGPIHRQWNIRSWPTTFILDANGLIRHRNLRDVGLEKAVEELLAEANN
jgi:peroxiredoxin